MTDRRIGRQDVIARLRWLADQPGFLNERQVFFRAAWMLDKDATTVFVGFSPQSSPDIPQERHGDETI